MYVTINVLFFFNDTATTEIYTLSLHDALPICDAKGPVRASIRWPSGLVQELHDLPLNHRVWVEEGAESYKVDRSEEHTSELQSHSDLVCRLLLEKKKLMGAWRVDTAESSRVHD